MQVQAKNSNDVAAETTMILHLHMLISFQNLINIPSLIITQSLIGIKRVTSIPDQVNKGRISIKMVDSLLKTDLSERTSSASHSVMEILTEVIVMPIIMQTGTGQVSQPNAGRTNTPGVGLDTSLHLILLSACP